MMIILNKLIKQYIKKSWILAWPIMLANLATPILAMTDAAILGHLPNPALLAALSIGTGIFAYILWGFNCISLSCATFTGSANASGDSSLIINRLLQFLFIAFVCAIILAILLQLITKPLLDILNISQHLKQFTAIYLKIMALGVIPLLMIQVSVAWFTGLKQPKIALYVLMISSFFNIVLDLVFVFVLKMDINGVALASICAQFISAGFVFIFIYLFLKSKHIKFKLNLQNWLSNKQVFNFGGTLLLRSGILLSVFLIFNLKSAQINDNTAAANALLMTILVLISNVLDAMASSAQVQISNNQKQIKLILLSTFMIMISFVIAFIVVILLFGSNYLLFMSNQTNIVNLAINYLPWMALLSLTSCTSYWLDGVFLGLQKSNWMRNAVLFASVLFYFPLVFLFDLNNHQLWLALNIFMIARSAFMWGYFLKLKSKAFIIN